MGKDFWKKYTGLFLLTLCFVLLQWLQSKPEWIEAYYSTGVYPYIGTTLRFLLGWVPFSIGDLLVVVVLVYLIYKLVKHIRIYRQQRRIAVFRKGFLSLVYKALWAYVVFYTLWGLAYYRQGSAYQLQIVPGEYTTQDLDTLLQHLNTRLYEVCADSVGIEQQKTQDRKVLASLSQEAYDAAVVQFAFLKFTRSSLKPMLLGPLQSYTGYSGYVFPFTGEAHVNFHAPPLDLPFSVCHEMAHQLGYGSESEANMVGFLAGRAHPWAWVKYSAYSNMQGYAQLEMLNRDSVLFKQYRDAVPPILIKDRALNDSFYAAHTSPVQPVINWVYEKYLFSNNQSLGIQSYNYVVAWLIAYGKKYGWHSL